MKSHRLDRLAKLHGVVRGLVLVIALPACHLVAWHGRASAQQNLETVRTAPEPAPQQPPENNWFNVSTPGVAALARPDSFLPYGPPPNGGCCCPGRKSGCCIGRILAWATYCPKERVCSCTACCNSCQYKGVLPIYPFFLNPKCVEGSGLHKTVPNECYRGCQDCAAGAAGGHP